MGGSSLRATLGISLLALVAFSACAYGTNSSARADDTRSGVPAGHAFLRAYRPYRTLGGLEAERTIIFPEDVRWQCAAYPRAPGRLLSRRLLDARDQLSSIRQELSLASP